MVAGAGGTVYPRLVIDHNTSEGNHMGKRAFYKRLDEFVAWDMDPGCRRFINQHSPSRRKLKKRLKRQARARINRQDHFHSKDDLV